jgi:hypothetical protein
MDYGAFTTALVERLRADPRVAGLVAVGSMAAVDNQPDLWSDHDFFVITASGGQEELRSDLSWLPWRDLIAFAFRETDQRLKVFYDDGHLIEFAVFDLEEVRLAAVDRYRVLLDRGGVAERVAEVAAAPHEQPTDEYLFGMFLSAVQVGAGRTARGERLSGRCSVVSGVRHFCRLVARVVPAESALLDEYDPLRRFEQVYPELGAELDHALGTDPLAVLDVAERVLRPLRIDLPWHALDAVRERAAYRP